MDVFSEIKDFLPRLRHALTVIKPKPLTSKDQLFILFLLKPAMHLQDYKTTGTVALLYLLVK